MMRASLWVVGLAACGGKGGGGATSIDNAGAADTGPRKVSFEALVACPPGLEARYAQKIDEEPGDEVSIRGCLPGRFGDAAWAAFIEAGPPSDSEAETGTSVYLAMLGDDGAERAFGAIGGYDWMSGAGQPAWLFDFDGDGVDELVLVGGGFDWTSVDVVRRAAGEVEVALSAPREEDRGPSAHCLLEVRVEAPATLVVNAVANPELEDDGGGEYDPYEGKSCDGDYRYTWRGGRFDDVELPVIPDEPDEEEPS